MKVLFTACAEPQSTRDAVLLVPGVNDLPDEIAQKYLKLGLVQAIDEAPTKGKPSTAKRKPADE